MNLDCYVGKPNHPDTWAQLRQELSDAFKQEMDRARRAAGLNEDNKYYEYLLKANEDRGQNEIRFKNGGAISWPMVEENTIREETIRGGTIRAIRINTEFS